jgi:cytidine deaminase
MKNTVDKAKLYEIANEERKKAYCPYSKISVGAALLAESGKIYTGANIENSAFTPGVCAERVAFFKAINEGERSFIAIAVAGGKVGEEPKPLFSPCGVCRQVMAEFCADGFEVIFSKEASASFSELLPYKFDKDSLI